MAYFKFNVIPLFLISVITLCVSNCASTKTGNIAPAAAARDTISPTGEMLMSNKGNRPVPNSIADEIPYRFYQAVQNGTRTFSGEPGPGYWKQKSNYLMNVELVPDNKKIIGNGIITYYNNSPDTLHTLALELTQNLHKKGVVRNEAIRNMTDGFNFSQIRVQDSSLEKASGFYELFASSNATYYIEGTLMWIKPSQMVLPGDSVQMQFKWNFTVPQKGAGGRMGWSRDNLFFIGYWYPKMRVYDDVNGWFTDPFASNAEFYHEFGNYQVNITVPEQWIVASTGSLKNSRQILQKPIYNRLQKAYSSDSIMTVAGKSDFGHITRNATNGKITWQYNAKNVRDFAFSVTKESIWDATRASVGDLNGDGQTDYSHIDAFYRDSAPKWTHAAKFAQESIHFLSTYTGLSYPWPHMTAVEGQDIIGGGMEYPMMTLIGPYSGRADQSLFGVIAHELAHMWVPMMISTDERRYSWMDEGTTDFNETEAKKKYYPNSNAELGEFMNYLSIAGTDIEGEIMRWSDYHYNSTAYTVASYYKPASLLITLRGLLGKETFNKAYRTYLKRWQYKHPYPWDMFNTFENISGRNLDWFWRSWYYETWILDQAVTDVSSTTDGSKIVIQDFGQVPMPANIEITLKDGTTLHRIIHVNTWLNGSTSVILRIKNSSGIKKVEIDPNYLFPDADRTNNVWQQTD